MGRRGRLAHPDVLTPREWEVLELLRERLTNEQIAQRLGITLDGAKYHVSEILSKLGVATREEAAGWVATGARPWWQRLVSLPFAAKIAAALTTVAVAAGLAILAWGVAETDRPPDSGPLTDWSSLPKPAGEPRLTREAALIEATRHLNVDPGSVGVEVTLTTFAGAERATGGGGEAPYDSEAAAWIVRLTGIFKNCALGPCGPAVMPPVTQPPPSCRDIIIFFPDAGPNFRLADGGPGLGSSSSSRPPSAPCHVASPPAPLSRDAALMVAALNPDRPVHQAPTPLKEAVAETMTLREAQRKVRDDGFQPPDEGAISNESVVWLVKLKGLFVPPPGQIEPSPPGPSDTRLVCTEEVTIVEASSGVSSYDNFRTAAGCYPSAGAGRSPVLTPSRTPTLTKDQVIRTTPEQAGIIPGQSPSEASADLLAFEESTSICYCYPPVERPDSVWVVTFKGLMSEPLNPKAPATPLPSEPRCSELVAVVSADTGNLFSSIFQHAESCS